MVDGITAVATGPDLRVCWRPGAGDAVLDGWTLAGVPPAAVVPAGLEGNCVLLIRDWAEPVSLTVTGAYAAEGVIPGVGRVALGLDAPYLATAELATETPISPLADGGAVGPHVRYGAGESPGQLHQAYEPLLFEATRCPDGEIDQAGAGLWCPAVLDQAGYRLALIDGDGVHPMTLGAVRAP